jgi:hypothetical protein
VTLVASLLGAPTTSAASSGACPGPTGVTVVVDFQGLGGGILVRCAPGSPSTGFAALAGAGLDVEQVRNTPGFLCRIDGRPGPDQERCINTPPATAYWSYWHASRGGSWVYSQLGAGNRKPPPGSVEGWSFAAGSTSESDAPKPGIAPPAPPVDPTAIPTPRPTARPTPKPTVSPTGTPRPPPTAGATAKPTATTKASPIAQASPSDLEEAPAESGSDATSPSGDPDAASPSADAGQSGSSPPAEVALLPAGSPGADGPGAGGGNGEVSSIAADGAPLGTLVGIGLVLAVAAGGALIGRRRRVPD